MIKLKIVPLGLAMGATRGVFMLLLGWLGPYGYGETFINMFESVYPGFTPGFVGGLIGAFWGFLDNFLGGLIIGFVYNRLAAHSTKKIKAG